MLKYPERELEIVPECIDETTGEPTCWAMKSGFDAGANRYHFIWITKYDEKEYVVEDSNGHNRAGKTFKTLWGAKRAAEGIIWRQDETGCYSD